MWSNAATNAAVGLEFKVDVVFSYRLIKDELVDLFNTYDTEYQDVIKSRGQAAIKNAAASSIPFEDFFTARHSVETVLGNSVRDVLTGMHAEMLTFHMLKITIPAEVRDAQLAGQVQIERNFAAEFAQEAAVERAETSYQVSSINLNKDRVLLEANAEADYLERQGVAAAQQVEQNSFSEGLAKLYNATAITTSEHKASMDYIRTLMTNAGTHHMSFKYHDEEAIVTTS